MVIVWLVGDNVRFLKQPVIIVNRKLPGQPLIRHKLEGRINAAFSNSGNVINRAYQHNNSEHNTQEYRINLNVCINHVSTKLT